MSLYKSIFQNTRDLQIQNQSKSKEQESSEEKRIQPNNVIDDQYDELIQKFHKDAEKIKQLLQVDQLKEELKTQQIENDQKSQNIVQIQDNQSKLESQLNQFQLSYNDQIKQNEILKKQNESTLNNLTKIQEDCNKYIIQIDNLNY